MQAETSERASCRSDKVSCMLSSAQAQGKPGWSFERPHTPAAPYANKPLQILDAKKKTEEPEIPPAVTKWVWTQCSWPCNLTEGSKMDLDSTLPVKQHWVWVTVISLVMFLWPAPVIPLCSAVRTDCYTRGPSPIYQLFVYHSTTSEACAQ